MNEELTRWIRQQEKTNEVMTEWIRAAHKSINEMGAEIEELKKNKS